MFRAVILSLLTALVVVGAVGAATEAEINEASALIENGEFKKARQRFGELVESAPGNALCRYYLGRAVLGLGDHDRAIEVFNKAIELDDSHSDSYHWRGMAYLDKLEASSFIKKKRIAGRIKDNFEAAVARDPENLEAREGLAHFYFEAPGFVGGDKDKALVQIAEIGKRDEERGHYVKADFHRHLGQWEAASAEYDKISQLLPGDPEPLYYKARALQDAERYVEAFEAFERVLTVDPGDMRTVYQLGRTAVLSGQNLGRGEVALQRFLATAHQEGTPQYTSAHWRLGMLYELQGRGDDAMAQYDRALELDPDNEEAKKSRKKLKKSRRKHRG